MNNVIQYNAFDDNAVEEARQRVGELSGSDFQEIPEGETVLRILPAIEGKAVRVTSMHYIDAVPGLDKKVTFACPRVEGQGECIACKEADRLRRTGSPTDRERAYAISAKMRVYVNVIDRQDPQPVVRVWGFGKKVWDQLIAIRKNARTGGDWSDPGPNGFDVVVTRKGTGQYDTEYFIASDRSPSPVAPTVEEVNTILEQTKLLDNFVQTTPDERLLLAWGNGPSGVPVRMPAGQLPQQARAAAQQGYQRGGGGGSVGANVMPAARTPIQQAAPPPARTAVQDAEFTDDVEYDEDMNPIPRR